MSSSSKKGERHMARGAGMRFLGAEPGLCFRGGAIARKSGHGGGPPSGHLLKPLLSLSCMVTLYGGRLWACQRPGHELGESRLGWSLEVPGVVTPWPAEAGLRRELLFQGRPSSCTLLLCRTSSLSLTSSRPRFCGQ